MAVDAQQEFDWNFRPDWYWDSPNAVTANIKGTFRRRLIQDAVTSGSLDAMPTGVFGNDVSDFDRIAMGMAIPGADSGEYLPDYKQEEVEVVRFTLNSTLCDVISIRARPLKGRITWRIVQDNPCGIMRLTRRVSKQPMTFRELTDMIMSIRCEWSDDWITAGWVEAYGWAWGNDSGTDSAWRWFYIESSFYPELEDWFKSHFKEWLEEFHRENEDEHDDD
jgi:hypothetical protein